MRNLSPVPSIRNILAMAAAAALVSAVVIAVITLTAVMTGRSSRSEVAERMDRIELAHQAQRTAASEFTNIVALAALEDFSYFGGYLSDRVRVEKLLRELIVKLEESGDEETLSKVESLAADHEALGESLAASIQTLMDGDSNLAMAMVDTTSLHGDAEALLSRMEAMMIDERAALSAAQDRTADSQIEMVTALSIILLVGGAFVLVVAVTVTKFVLRPLSELRKSTNRIARGERNVMVPDFGATELGALGRDVNAMAKAINSRSDALETYLSLNLESRTEELEKSNAELTREVKERIQAEAALADTLATERELEAQLKHQAFHDSLTGLANRAQFLDRLDHDIELAQRAGRTTAVIFLDLDDFKSINDSWGHSQGDEVLRIAARRVKRAIRPGDTAARLGGDEFAVIIADPESVEEVLEVAHRLRRVLHEEIRLNRYDLFLGSSLGVAIGAAPDETSSAELIHRADLAMYAAKRQGKGHIRMYEESLEADSAERLALASAIEHGVGRKEFILHYQPVVSLATEEISGVEALVRWNHPERGFLSPDEFIPVAEQSGLIVELGNRVVKEAILTLAEWKARDPDRELTMAINISARQLFGPELLETLKEAFVERAVNPSSIVLEITETSMMQDVEEAIVRLEQLRALGVRLALDDFGTGFSSISYVKRFPIDIIKIDKSYVDGLGNDGRDSDLVRTIVSLGHSLGLTIIAEGIERVEQVEFLKALECHEAQGFYFAKPAAPEAIRDLLGPSGSQAA